jgi:hypothetical protein
LCFPFRQIAKRQPYRAAQRSVVARFLQPKCGMFKTNPGGAPMKRVFTGTCLAAVFAVGLSAQSTGTQPQTYGQEKKDSKDVTVTGCLRAGDEPNTYVLQDVKWDDKDKSATGAAAGAGAATGTAGAASAAMAATKIKLIGAPAGVQLSEHVGHTVQITGMLAPAAKATAGGAAAGTGAATGTAGTAGAAAGAAKDQALNVRTVKMVSSSCNQ